MKQQSMGFSQPRFPIDDYTPYGYLRTPTHTGLHPSGVVRSAPPLGFGIFTGGLRWYGMSMMRHINNYVCLVLPSVKVGCTLLCEREDFDKAGIALNAKYHSANVMSYDFEAEGVSFSFLWYLQNENALTLKVVLRGADAPRDVRVDVEQRYGMNGVHWWGSDEATARYRAPMLISKILAYGDVFCMKPDIAPQSGVTAQMEEELRAWQRGELTLEGKPRATRLPDPICSALRFELRLSAREEKTFTLVLARGVNEKEAVKTADAALSSAKDSLAEKLEEDDAFYRATPLLSGDWPEAWRRGWVTDFETLRMNILDPVGIYKHRWDGMQALNPRVVVGETAIDMLTMGYADIPAALEVMEGLFADAPDVYVPCSREDGSVNMIGEDGSECATAPIWGMPLRAIRILLSRSGDLGWLRRLYPRLKAYVQWWQQNRTDEEGWYHCNNSWESGQDGSVRFITKQNKGKGLKEAANAESVRTADLEAAMASAMEDMAFFADLLGEEAEQGHWLMEAAKGRGRVQAMFVDTCYRDFDAVTKEPIIPENHYDIMLTMPVALGMATPDQKEKIRWLFDMYEKQTDAGGFGMGYASFWPPLLQTLTEAIHQMGDFEMAARMVSRLVGPAWERNDARMHWPGDPTPGVPEKYCIRIPGVGRENLSTDLPTSGAENYGWGCLGPALVLENIIGLRPEDALGHAFSLRPVLPAPLYDGRYTVHNLTHGAYRFDLTIHKRGETLDVSLRFFALPGNALKVNGREQARREFTVTVREGEKLVIG